jgi:hypothetical protein
LYGFTSRNRNGREIPAPELVPVNGANELQFIDGTRDTFFNTFRRVKFSKSCSKCYFVNERPYQLIYNSNNNVYQYSVYEPDRIRTVVQNSEMSQEDVERQFSLSSISPLIQQYRSNTRPSNPAYVDWETRLYDAISNGKISIDQIYNFLYDNRNTNKSFKAGKIVGTFWAAFHSKYKDVFF